MNRMRRIGLLAAAAALLLTVPGAVMAFGDAKGPPCSDLVSGDASKVGYSQDETTGDRAVDAQLQLSKAACANLTYTFYVLSEDGLTVLGQDTGTPATDANTGEPVVQFHVSLGTSGPATVQTYATTARGTKVLDRGPDAGYLPLTLEASGGGRGYQ